MTSAQQLRSLLPFSLLLPIVIAGCGAGSPTTRATGSLAINGHVHGGMQPVVGATVQLYAAGSAGNGSQAMPLLASPVLTDSHSSFALTGSYTCPSANTPVYLVARGGNPGFDGTVNNSALVLLTALGSCGSLAASPNQVLEVNEVTTVAAAYALAPFLTAFDHVGASATNTTGLANAFLNTQLLANSSTGLAPQLPSNLTTESGKLYALADALAPCVNSTGSGSPCGALFAAATPSGGTAPSDVLGALLNIVKNPGNQVGAVFSLVGSTPPWATSLTSAPHDWTMSLSVVGGGLAEPTALAIDAAGDVWVTNYGGRGPAGLVAYTPQGTPFAGSPFGAGLQTDAYGLTLDKNGDVWVSSYDNQQSGSSTGSVAKFQGAGSSTPGALLGHFADSTLSQPEAIAADPAGSGSILIGNFHNGTVTFYNLGGQFQKVLGGSANGPNAVASDGAGGAWVGDQGDHNVFHFRADGSAQAVACCNAVQTLKLDLHGNVWTTNFTGIGNPAVYTFSEVAPDGTVLLNEQSGGGLFAPGNGAIDAGGKFWVANYYGVAGAAYGSFTEIAGNDGAAPPGTPLSPSTGFGLDAAMSLAYALAPDPSGNLWVSIRNGDSLRMFFGIATPTATPAGPLPAAP